MNQEQRKAYEWAKNQDYPSVAARYAKILAGLVDEMAKPNEPLTLDKKRVIAESCLHYSKSGCCTLQGYAPLDCPRCKEWHSNESNEALALEQLRKMDGEPVWVKCLKPDKYTYPPVGWRILETAITGNFGVWNGDCVLIERDYGTDWLAYRRPPEGEA